jgi:hypothetical protein
MIARPTRPLPPSIAHTRRRFESWRKTRPPTSRIPDALWAMAVKAASEHGINQTARALRLNHTALKKRLPSAGGRRQRPQPASGAATFVEFVPPPMALSPCTIELENTQGAKMRIHLARPEALDLVALSRSLWSVER